MADWFEEFLKKLRGKQPSPREREFPFLPQPPDMGISGRVTASNLFQMYGGRKVELQGESKLYLDEKARSKAIVGGKKFYKSLIHGGEEVSVINFPITRPMPTFEVPSLTGGEPEKINAVTRQPYKGEMETVNPDTGRFPSQGEPSMETDGVMERSRERAMQSPNPLIRWASTPTAILGLTPSDIAGIVAIGIEGASAVRSIYDAFLGFRRLPEFKAFSQVAKEQNIPKNSPEYQNAQNTIRSAYNLYKRGMPEAAEAIMKEFTDRYYAFMGKGMPSEVPQAAGTIPALSRGGGLPVPKFTPGGSAIPGQTRPLADMMAAGAMALQPEVPPKPEITPTGVTPAVTKLTTELEGLKKTLATDPLEPHSGEIRKESVQGLADKYTRGDVKAFKDRVNQIRAMKQRVVELEREIRVLPKPVKPTAPAVETTAIPKAPVTPEVTIPKELNLLVDEAKKYNTFEEFEKAIFSEGWKREQQFKTGLMGDVATMGFPKATEIATKGEYIVSGREGLRAFWETSQGKVAIPKAEAITTKPEITPVPEVTKAQYKDYQEVHNAVKAGKLKIGDRATVEAYGGQTIEIVPPEYKGELDQMGLPLKYRIKEVTPPVTEAGMPEAPAVAPPTEVGGIGGEPPIPPKPTAVVAPEPEPGKYWLPEPPRQSKSYLEVIRKAAPGSYKGKEGVFNIIEDAHQLVLKAKDLGKNAMSIVESYIHVIGTTEKEFGIDKSGLATKVDNPGGRSLAINDVLSNYTKYNLTPKQVEIAKRHGFVYGEAKKLARSYGIKISDIGNIDELWQYVARRVIGKVDPTTGKRDVKPPTIGGFEMGAKISAQKQRIFDEMLQGVDLGFLYENPDQTLATHILGIYRLIGNKQAEELVKPLTRVLPQGVRTSFGEKYLYAPALANRVAASEIVEAIEKIYTIETHNKALRIAAEISGALVGQVAAFDISAPYIQGLPLLGHDLKRGLQGKPSALWLKSYIHMLKTVINPESINKYREDNSELYKKATEHGVQIGQSEFVSSVPTTGKILGKIPVAGKTIREVYKQTWGRLGEAYSDFLEIGAIKLYEQLESAWESEGQNLYELGGLANRMMGRGVNLQLSSNRRFIERIVAFAPNYIRASLLLMKDLVSKGKTAREVQTSIAALLAIGALVYYSEEKLHGEEPKMRPWAKKWGGDGAEAYTTRIGNTRVGFGSFMYGMLKLVADLGAMAVDDPSALVVWNDQHPLARFLESKRGAAISLAVELATGRNFFGKPFEGVGDYLMRIVESFIPISAQSLVTQEPKGEVAQVGAEFLGLRAFPYSLKSQWMDEDKFFKTYYDLPTNSKIAEAKGTISRTAYRRRYPEVDAKLFIAGTVQTIREPEKGYKGTTAGNWVIKLVKDNKIDPFTISGVKNRIEYYKELEEGGVKEMPNEPVDILVRYFISQRGKSKTGGTTPATPKVQPPSGMERPDFSLDDLFK